MQVPKNEQGTSVFLQLTRLFIGGHGSYDELTIDHAQHVDIVRLMAVLSTLLLAMRKWVYMNGCVMSVRN